MKQKAQEHLDKSVMDALLKLATQMPWRAISLERIAHETPFSSAEISHFHPTPASIAAALVGSIDDQLESLIDTTRDTPNPKDRLFDILMNRFDLLQKNRESVIALAKASRQFPDLAAQILQAHWISIGKILAMSHIECQGPALFLQKTGLLAVFHFTFQRWEKDESPDLEKTMAALNRSLHKFSYIFSSKKTSVSHTSAS